MAEETLLGIAVSPKGPWLVLQCPLAVGVYAYARRHMRTPTLAGPRARPPTEQWLGALQSSGPQTPLGGGPERGSKTTHSRDSPELDGQEGALFWPRPL